MSDKTFDAVVIGSGLGGLTAGALLAQSGYSVCLLERNFSLGGAASVYKVGPLTVEASLHQTSDARNPRDVKHDILRRVGILDEIEWLPTGALYTVRGGPVGEAFELPFGFGPAYEALAARFPDKRAAIQRFLGEVEQIHDALWTLKQAREESSFAKFARGLWELEPAAAGWQNSLHEIMERDFAGCEALKCALGANLAYYGDDPRRLWWIFYALAQGGYIASGGAYIKGGSRQLSLKLAKAITKTGGVVRLGRLVNAIETDSDGAVVAIRHVARRDGEGEERIAARVVMANCAPSEAAGMMDAPARAKMEEAFGARKVSTSLFAANFGLSAAGKVFDLEPNLGNLVVGQTLRKILLRRIEIDARIGLRAYSARDLLPPARVWNTDDSTFGNIIKAAEDVFDFAWINVAPTADQHLLQSAGNAQQTVFVDHSQVASP